jgi:hypothetical protein
MVPYFALGPCRSAEAKAMVIELFLFSSVGAILVGTAYVRHLLIQEKKASERKRQEGEAQFRLLLQHELRSPSSGTFRLSEFSAKCAIPKNVADRVADDIYCASYHKVLVSGITAAKDRKRLDSLAQVLEIDTARMCLIEKRAREAKYEQAVSGVLADGEITSEEAAHLEQIRRQMGISKEDAFQLTKDASRSAYLTT